MSKRYGRNQKRAAKAEKASLEGRIRLLNHDLSIKNESEHKAAMVLDIARDINPNAPMFDPERYDMNLWRWSPVPKMQATRSFVSMDSFAMHETFKIIDLWNLEAILTEGGDFAEYVHFEIAAKDRSSVNVRSQYRISKRELSRVQDFDGILERICRDLVRHFRKSLLNIR